MIPTARDVLLVIDVQGDFLPGGALAVPGGDAVIAPVNRLLGLFPHAVLTQDWHPPGHVSFATSHPGRAPFDTVPLAYGAQVLWPEHCVQGSPGADLSAALEADRAELVIRKGHHRQVDSYSAFLEADRRTPTGLTGYLRERGFTRVVLCGLATDYCVAWSALDARAAGFEALVVEDAVRGIDLDGSVARAWAEMTAAGVGRVTSGAIGG
ncbi:bifunctional nicotinamidase/pyrazinamidase [Methylobacterium sp. J-078]|uniref:bifunctional nicotinamidase/pyrazinamidase n=1 Tax=Methylobacterium sp. J-078 TaxID=2836657 RepID=UPI001FB8F2B6|nr:bifunctional nicotinamidase/pyrazinamidase [Methylobacterium sp. J-078]MCJ2046125.1 bifunctional nicotinamidase/pyrazinamidase [Methylobacterium sp. J-078]